MCQLYLNQVCDLAHCEICYELIKYVHFNEAHIANHLMHLIETFAVKLLQVIVSHVSPKQVLARIRFIELKKLLTFLG